MRLSGVITSCAAGTPVGPKRPTGAPPLRFLTPYLPPFILLPFDVWATPPIHWFLTPFFSDTFLLSTFLLSTFLLSTFLLSFNSLVPDTFILTFILLDHFLIRRGFHLRPSVPTELQVTEYEPQQCVRIQ